MDQTIETRVNDSNTYLPDHGAAPQAVKFARSDEFLQKLKKRVDAYFVETGKKPRDCGQMYFKTATIVIWFVGTYILLMFAVSTWWLVVPLALLMGLAMAAVGFNIQHDGGHRAYSNHK